MPRLMMTLFALALTLWGCSDEEPSAPRGIAKPGSAAAKAGAKAGAAATPSKAAPKSVAATAFELAPVDVSIDDFKAVMQAPKGAVGTREPGAAQVKLDDGKQFWVQVALEAPDLKAIKDAAEKNTVQKLVRVHTETDDVLIYESTAFGRTSVWLDMAIRVGARRVHCASGRGAFSYDRGHIEAFKAACESLELKR